MKTLTFSKLPEIGINPLTGEACAFSMRILCDLSQEGADLMRDYLGLSASADVFNPNWNSFVGDKPAVASIMVERDMFSKIMIFALFREGYKYVMASQAYDSYTAYSDDDLASNGALKAAHEGVRDGKAEHVRLYVNPKATSTAPSVGSRNVHQFTGRTE